MRRVPRDLCTASTPRRSRGPYDVSRSKRLFGDANAAPSSGLGHLRVGPSEAQFQLLQPLIFEFLAANVRTNHRFIPPHR